MDLKISTQPLRVLIADDEKLIVKALARRLAGHEVVCAYDGEQAIEALAGPDFDLVFCDLMMPVLTGMDVYQHVERQRPHMCSRFVFMTGGTLSRDVRRFLMESEVPCLFKPFNHADFVSTAKGVLAETTSDEMSALQ